MSDNIDPTTIYYQCEDAAELWWQQYGKQRFQDIPKLQAIDIFATGWRLAVTEFTKNNKDRPGEFI